MSRLALTDAKGRPVETPRPLAPLADTHGHINCLRDHDAAEALTRAALAGVRLLVVPLDAVEDVGGPWPTASDLLTWLDDQVERARELLDARAREGVVPPAADGWDAPDLLDNVRIVAGVHPYGADRLDAARLATLDELLASPRAVGVGEIGLDLGPYGELPLALQEEAFRRQLRLAHERGLPVELHIRDGQDDTRAHDLAARVLMEEGVPAAGCDLHCFTQGSEVMEPFVRLGCYVAFGGAATFRRSDDVRAALAACPEELLITETDCPYMAPVPLRGQECEPAMVAFTAALAAQVRAECCGVPPKQTYAALWRNACALFGLDAPAR
ncbi:TatD family hydrolase [Olsenella sp. HMSC062G07]|uniref:TatD family hydrolase n=1 Tax=Olsenella sp. HMSC062G07 TaxID=1739330 RepID=UPI0008A484C7|nr:TatD family hydrolase [Olsenella sp. HMSC062G07]OFK23534.1 hydrolase TatD [Olsenella sp. HMSC062G07]